RRRPAAARVPGPHAPAAADRAAIADRAARARPHEADRDGPAEPIRAGRDRDVVTPGVRLLLAPNPSPMTGTGTNTYLLGQRNLVVIDPGPDLPEHVDAIVARGRVVAQLVTHAHADHLPAALRVRERVGAPIYGHRA